MMLSAKERKLLFRSKNKYTLFQRFDSKLIFIKFFFVNFSEQFYRIAVCFLKIESLLNYFISKESLDKYVENSKNN